MKIMYVGCNPDDEDDLLLDSEVTELARLFRSRQGETIDFLPLPRLPIEELPLALSAEAPTILHIASHAGDGKLLLANAYGKKVELDGRGLATYLELPSPPVLVYLNGCNSESIAKELVPTVSIAIGTTSAIRNKTARAAAIQFYDRIISGATVNQAFEVGRVTMSTMQDKDLQSHMYAAKGVDPARLRLYRTPYLIGRFRGKDFKQNKDNEYDIEFGIAGCPSNTSQVVFFSDETSDEKPENVCTVVRGTPVNNIFWNLEYDDQVSGDYRIYATGTTTSGSAFTVASSACDALEAYFALLGVERASIPEPARAAIETLRRHNGTNLIPESELFKKKRGSPKRK